MNEKVGRTYHVSKVEEHGPKGTVQVTALGTTGPTYQGDLVVFHIDATRAPRVGKDVKVQFEIEVEED